MEWGSAVIFAELQVTQHYSAIHVELHTCLAIRFPRVEHGLQGDSWLWVWEGDERVSVDTFTSMQHQVKAPKSTPLVQRVVEALARQYRLQRFDPPLLEGHE